MTALPVSIRWISLVPSKIVKIVDYGAVGCASVSCGLTSAVRARWTRLASRGRRRPNWHVSRGAWGACRRGAAPARPLRPVQEIPHCPTCRYTLLRSFPQRYRRDPGADGAELRNSRSSPPEVCPVCAGAEFGSGPNFVMAAGSGGVVDSLAGSYRVVEVPAVCLFG